MSLFDVVNALRQYSGASASNPPANTEQDFQAVAQSAPAPHLAGGLAQAFRSNETPAFPQMLSTLFTQSNGTQKAGILNQLLGSVGSSGSMLPGGLAGLLNTGSNVTPQQAEQIPPESVQQLAEHAQRNDPSIVDQASSFYAQHPQVVQALGAGALALIMSHMSQRQ